MVLLTNQSYQFHIGILPCKILAISCISDAMLQVVQPFKICRTFTRQRLNLKTKIQECHRVSVSEH